MLSILFWHFEQNASHDVSWNQYEHCSYTPRNFLVPACPVLKSPRTLILCYMCTYREKPGGVGASSSLLGRVRGLCCCSSMYMNDYWVKSIKGPLLFWKEVYFQKGIILSFFHLTVLIHYCTVYVVIISTAMWIRSCCIRNRKHPSHELKG